jgi:hypothetical protein
MSENGVPFNSGAVVEVRSADEIAATLDADGTLDGVPFMEEMRRFCGRRFRVFKRADKICVERPGFFDLKGMQNTVFLEEVRCDGSAHDGCGRLCMIFWKEAWLKPAPAGAAPEPPIDWVRHMEERDRARVALPIIDESKVYRCQSTTVDNVAKPLKSWDLRHYVNDIRTGSLRPTDLFQVLFLVVYNRIAGTFGKEGWGKVAGKAKKTPIGSLDLRPGELVRVKRKGDVELTLDQRGRNRGLNFGDMEISRHCGVAYRVLSRVDRIILEDTGKMRKIENTVILQGTGCSGLNFRGCARHSFPLWREIWLERIPAGASDERT